MGGVETDPQRRRLQLSIKTMLVATLVVAAFFGGMAYGKKLARQEYAEGWLELEEMRGALDQGSSAARRC